MKVSIQSSLLKLALGALLLSLIGCSSTSDTASTADNNTAVVARPTAISSPSNLAKPISLRPTSKTDEVAQIKARYGAWKQSWADMKIDTFMSFYSPKVRSGKVGYAGIRERKIRQWQKERYIQITDIGAPTIKVKGNSATLTALQVYDSTTWWDKGQKSLTWQKSGGRWLIVQESFKAQSQRSKTAPVVAAAPPPINQVVESQPVPDDAVNADGSSVWEGGDDSSDSDTDTDSDFSSPSSSSSLSSNFGSDASSSSSKISPQNEGGACSAGAMAVCRDGTTSYSANRRGTCSHYSANRRGTCSHHGGVARWCP